MAATGNHISDGRGGLQVSPEVESYFRKRHPQLLRKLMRAARGETDPEARAFVISCRGLAAKFQLGSPRPNRKLAALAATRLTEVVEYANKLSERLNEIKRTRGRGARREVRLLLAQIYETELSLLHRRIEKLHEDIPRLIEELGGDSSKELLLHRKPRSRLAERDRGRD